VTLALLLLVPAGVLQLFADANTAYLSGDVARAIAAYEALEAEGIASPELETNLGAAYLRQGKRGMAALHFERALFLDPGDDDARADLTEVRRGNVDRLEGESEEGGTETLARVLAPLPGGVAAVLLVALWTAAWVLLGVRMYRPELRLGAFAVGAFALAFLAAGVTYGAALGRDLALQRAVVVAQAVPSREGPGEKSVSHFEIHEGTTVRIEDEDGQFRRIKLANGLTGWVPSSAVELVVPPGWAGRPVLTGSPRAQQP
jgi:tetratricopeptide (TPR) repeat protein